MYCPVIPVYFSNELITKLIALSLFISAIKITKAVSVHKTIVSIKTSNIPRQPWE